MLLFILWHHQQYLQRVRDDIQIHVETERLLHQKQRAAEMRVSPLFLWSVSLAGFVLLDLLSHRQENTCSVMTENPYKATIAAHKMTTVLRFAQKEVLMFCSVLNLWSTYGRHPQNVTSTSPLFCNVFYVVSHLSTCAFWCHLKQPHTITLSHLIFGILFFFSCFERKWALHCSISMVF